MAHEVARILSYDFFLFQMIVGVVYNLCIVFFPRLSKRDKIMLLIIFHTGGFLNWFGEFLAINFWDARHFALVTSSGIGQYFATNDPFGLFIVFNIGWLDHGLLFTTAYILIKYWVRPGRLPKKFVVIMTLIYGIGITVTSFDFGIFGQKVWMARMMQDFIDIMLIVAFFALIAFFIAIRYRKLVWRIVIVGFIMSASFELRMVAAGIRGYHGASTFVGALIGTSFEMNSGLLFSFFLILILFGYIFKDKYYPRRYSDSALEKSYEELEKNAEPTKGSDG